MTSCWWSEPTFEFSKIGATSYCAGRDLVVAGLDRHAELGQLALGVEHEREHALGDRAEVVVVELVALGRLGAEERAARRDEVGALEVVLLVDQEVLLLGADRREDRRGLASSPSRRSARIADARQRVHRAQQRDLVVQRLAGPRRERGRDAEQRAVGVLEDEGRRRRVPRGVAAGLERRADAAGRERRRVRLALDELLAGELGDRVPSPVGRVEGVVLLGGDAGQRLEPVREVRRALLHRPLLHRRRDRVGERGSRARPVERLLELLVDGLGQPLALDGAGEDVGAEDVGAGLGQVGLADRAPVGAPLGGVDVLTTGAWHGRAGPPQGYGGQPIHARACAGVSTWTNIRTGVSPSGRTPAGMGEARAEKFRHRAKDPCRRLAADSRS